MSNSVYLASLVQSLVEFDFLEVGIDKYNKHNAQLQRTDPGTKVTGEFSTRGHIFSPNV